MSSLSLNWYRGLRDDSTSRDVIKLKNTAHQERVENLMVEDVSFTPMIMSSAGGLGPKMSIALKYLEIALKEDIDYSSAVRVSRARFAFAAARTMLVCLRGLRSLSKNRRLTFAWEVGDHDGPVALVAAET